MNSYKLTVWSVTVLLLLGVTGFAAEREKAQSAKEKATAVKQEKKPAAETIPVTPQQSPPEQSSAEAATGEQIDWLVISKGGSYGTSSNYGLGVTVGQNAAGYGSSTNYGLNLGFWQNFTGVCCVGVRGNVNGDPDDKINVADITYLVDRLFRDGPAPPCYEEADVNADTRINVADLTYLVDRLFRDGPLPLPCP